MLQSVYNTDETRLRREVSELLNAQQALLVRIQSLESNAQDTSGAVRSAGDNILRNSEAEYSDDAYNNLGLGGDADKRIAHWYRHEDSDTLLVLTTAELLKDASHSAYVSADDDADWEKSSGRIRVGTKR